MTSLDTPYFLAAPYIDATFLEVPAVPTVVSSFTDYPMANMATAFDSTFTALFPALGAQSVQPAGPAFSLYTRTPSDTVDFEIGIPVDRALSAAVSTDSGVTLRPSRLPAGRVAVVSHLGSFDGLGEAWATFMQAIADAGHQPVLPLWEIYVTEPTPAMDPATLRTDLVTLVS